MITALTALVSWYSHISYAEQKNPEEAAAEEIGPPQLMSVKRVESDPQKEGAVPTVEEAAPDPTNKWPVMEMTTVEPDQPATNGLELKVADPVLPEGAEKIDISAVTLGSNDWKKEETHVEKSPLLSMEYTNEKIEKRLYLQLSGMGDNMTFYKVYRGKEGDKPIKSKATNKLPDEYEQIGTLKMPIGTKETKEIKEEKLTSTLNLFYYILKMREEKGLKGNIVCVYGGNKEDSYAYILPP